MSKKVLVCTILALSLILVGTGYAYWTDSLNVTTKATTGDLDVTFADLGLYAQYGNEYNAGNWSIIDGIGDAGYVEAGFFERGSANYNIIAKDGSIEAYLEGALGYNNVNFDAKLVDPQTIKTSIGDAYVAGQTNGSDNILLTVNNMYPGYAQAFRTDILNVGDIAAKLSSVKVSTKQLEGFDTTETFRNMLGLAILIDKEAYNGNPYETHDEDVFKLSEALGLPDSAVFELGGVEFVRLTALQSISQEALAASNNLLTIPSDNRMDLFLGIAMDPDAEGAFTTGSTTVMSGKEDALSQLRGITISVDLLWDQFNQGKDVDATNRLEKQNR